MLTAEIIFFEKMFEVLSDQLFKAQSLPPQGQKLSPSIFISLLFQEVNPSRSWPRFFKPCAMTLRQKTLFILIISLGLLFLAPIQRFEGPFLPKKLAPELHTRLMLLRYDFKNKELANLAFATVTGVKRGLKKDTKLAHQRLHLIHLFTPSGLHFSTLFMLLSPFFIAWKKTRKTRWLMPLLALALVPQIFSGFWAMKRVGLLKFAFLFLKVKQKHLSPFSVFLLVFFFDFFFGTYSDSPVSFGLSFLFLGLIFSSLGEGKLIFALNLFLGQLVASLFFDQPVFIVGFVFGLFMTGLFTLIYPFIFLAFLLAPWFQSSWVEPLIGSYLQFVLTLSELNHAVSDGQAVDFVVILSILLFLGTRLKWTLMLLLLSAPLTPNLPSSHSSAPWYYKQLGAHSFTEIVRHKKGYRLKTQKGSTCLIKLYQKDLWSEYCRYDWGVHE